MDGSSIHPLHQFFPSSSMEKLKIFKVSSQNFGRCQAKSGKFWWILTSRSWNPSFLARIHRWFLNPSLRIEMESKISSHPHRRLPQLEWKSQSSLQDWKLELRSSIIQLLDRWWNSRVRMEFSTLLSRFLEGSSEESWRNRSIFQDWNGFLIDWS